MRKRSLRRRHSSRLMALATRRRSFSFSATSVRAGKTVDAMRIVFAASKSFLFTRIFDRVTSPFASDIRS